MLTPTPRELAPLHLPRRCLRQLLHQPDATGHLEQWQPVKQPGMDDFARDGLVLLEHHRSHNVFTQYRIRHGEHRRLRNGGMAAQGRIHLVWDDLLPAAVDRLDKAAGQVQVAGRIQKPDIPGAKPTIREEGSGVGLWIIQIPREETWSPHHDLPSLVLAKGSPMLVHDLDVTTGNANGPCDAVIAGSAFAGDSGHLSHSVPIEQRDA